MNKYLYIPPFSHHNKNLFKAFIQSEIKRFYKINTSEQQTLQDIQNFKTRLIDRA
jgi:hypothetical protein